MNVDAKQKIFKDLSKVCKNHLQNVQLQRVKKIQRMNSMMKRSEKLWMFR